MRVRDHLKRLHRFLKRNSFYAVLLSSLLSHGLLAGRIYVSGDASYGFMLWNLILAWLPYVFGLMAAAFDRRYRSAWALLVPGLLWLLFFPNGPYMLTDLIHLEPRAPIPMWYDIVLLTAFAWTGCLLAVASLNMMQSLIRAWLGRLMSWLFVVLTLGLTGLGIYLGRFLNWNSWDVFLQPGDVIADVLTRLTHPLEYLGVYGVTFLFAAFLFVFYLAFVSARASE